MAKKRIIGILRVDPLTGKNALVTWIGIVIFFLMCITLIFSSHLVDQKVFEITRLNDEVKELKGEFVDVRSKLQKTRLESTVKQSLGSYGLRQSEKPPQKIKVIVKE